MVRYLHTLTYASAGTTSTFNEATGTWSAEAPGGAVTVECRARPSKPNTIRPRQDGKVQESSFDLGFPKGTVAIPEGSVCTVRGVRSEVLITGHLIDYLEGDLSIRGWI